MSGNKRAKNKLSKSREVTTIEQSYEESILPSADELEKLQILDSSILPWIKDRTDSEQNHRHGVDRAHVKIVSDNNRRVFVSEVLKILSVLVIILASMGFSVFLLLQGLEVQGTIFAGGSVSIAVWGFLKVKKPPKEEE